MGENIDCVSNISALLISYLSKCPINLRPWKLWYLLVGDKLIVWPMSLVIEVHSYRLVSVVV